MQDPFRALPGRRRSSKRRVDALIGHVPTGCQGNGNWRPGGSIQYDGRDQPAVVRLLAMGSAAVAEEPLLVGVSVERQVLESADSGARRALRDIGVEAEHR